MAISICCCSSVTGSLFRRGGQDGLTKTIDTTRLVGRPIEAKLTGIHTRSFAAAVPMPDNGFSILCSSPCVPTIRINESTTYKAIGADVLPNAQEVTHSDTNGICRLETWERIHPSMKSAQSSWGGECIRLHQKESLWYIRS